MQSHYKEK